MQNEMSFQPDELHLRLRPFQTRVRVILAWRCLAVAGTIGAAVALLGDLGDWRGYWHVEPAALIVPLMVALAAGVGYALLRPLPAEALAQLIDHRAALKDRVTSALLCRDNPFSQPLREDALLRLSEVRPAQLFRFRFAVWHVILALLLLLLLTVRFLPFLPLPFSKALRHDRREARQMAEEVRRVLKPVVAHAGKPVATPLEKSIARQVQEMNRRARYGRLSKKQAMVQLNKLLAEAAKLERQQQQQMQSVSQKALTASETLKHALTQKALSTQMPELQPLQRRLQDLQKQLQSGKNAQGQSLSDAERQQLQQQLETLQRTMDTMGQQQGGAAQQQMQSLQRQISQMQKMLQSGRNAQGQRLSKAEREALQQQLKNLQEQLRALKLSQQAQEFMRKLMNDPNYQKAMELLQRLQQKMGKEAQEKSPQMSAQDLDRMQKELERVLEAMAKQYGSDQQIKDLAKQLLEAAKQAKELKQCGNCAGWPGHKPHAGFG